MSLDLAFTPAGHVTAVELTAEQAVDFGGESQADGRLKKVAKAFAAARARDCSCWRPSDSMGRCRRRFPTGGISPPAT